MLTRYVFFEGSPTGDVEAFRATIVRELLPLWQGMPDTTGVRLTFAHERDDGAPEFLMILAVDYPDRASLDASLASAHRDLTRDRSAEILAARFSGRIHHHVTCDAT
jgi:hypothetical protein